MSYIYGYWVFDDFGDMLYLNTYQWEQRTYIQEAIFNIFYEKL